nr:MAG TPA: tail protein [Caudoviricetes sp.]
MTYITYENEAGRLEFCGGGGAPLRIIAIDGLGIPPRTFETAAYYRQPGQETLSATDEPRTITIKFDLNSCGDIIQDVSQITRILYHPGTLTIYNSNRQRSINCYCGAFEPADRYRQIRAFAAQFVCDFPYFTDGEIHKNDIIKVTNLIKTRFSFPMPFSTLVAEADIVNLGDVDTEPEFYIYNTGSAFTDKVISIYNDTTGQKVSFRASMGLESAIQVNIAARQILLDSTDITSQITTDTFLSDFWLQPGKNHIRADTADHSGGLGVVCCHRNLYIEAVI